MIKMSSAPQTGEVNPPQLLTPLYHMKKISTNSIIFVLLVLVFIIQKSWTPAIITGVATFLSIVTDYIKER